MTIGELINSLAQKAGLAVDDANLKKLLEAPELASVQVPDEVGAALDTGLLSIEAAKNNHPDIKRKYFAEAFNGIDNQLIRLIETDTFSDEELAEIKAEKSTVKKAELIVAKLKAQKAAKPNNDEINRQLAAAHEAARLAKDEVASVKAEYESKIKTIHTKAAIRNLMAGYKTIYDDLPADIRSASMEAIVQKALQDKQAELVADEHGNLTLMAKDGSNVFGSNHVQLTPQSFLDQTFAPILKVSGPAPNSNTRPTPTAAPVPGASKDEASAHFVKSHTEQVLAEFSQPKPSLM
jgi:hypothetical protein